MPPRTSLRLATAFAAAILSVGCGGGSDAPPADTTAPAITSATPANAATGVARNVAPRFTFSEAIDLATVTPATVVFEDAQGAAVPYDEAFDAATNVLTLTPTSPPLANYRGYSVTLGTGVKDLAGNGLAAARTFAFTTADDVLPGAPGTPGGPGVWATASPVAFGWTEASDAGSGVASYRLEVATATDGSGTQVFSGDVGAVLSHAVAAADGQTIYARVAAVDGAGNAGPWSSWSSAVGVDLTAPALSSGVGDAGAWDGHPGDSTVAFTWGAAVEGGSGLAGYEVEVALGATSGAIVDSGSPTVGAWTFGASGLDDGDVLFARVRALDVAGNASAWSGWSDGVTLDAAAPGAPGTPAGPGAFALATPVRFAWAAAAEAVSGVSAYRVQVVSATDGSGETFFDGGLGNVLFLDVPATDGKHLFARAAATDAAGFTGSWSAWSSEVVVDLQPPSAPGIPADAGDLTESPARFTWGPATDANGVASYVLEVTTQPDGGGAIVYATNVGAVLAADVPAADGQTLYGRVRAVDAAGRQGGWSASSNGILVDRTGPAAPGVPQHPEPFDDASVAFSWTAATSQGSPIVAYLFEVSTSGDFSNVVYSTTVTDLANLSATYPSGQDGQTVYARVRAQDGLGHVGPVSGTSAGVTVDLAPPTVPGVPDDGGAAQADATVHLSWAPSTDAGIGVQRYTVEIRENGALVATREVTAPAAALEYIGSGTAGAVVTARVRATDALGNQGAFSGWSDGIAINVATVPGTPGTPTEVPALQYTSETMITFQWSPPVGGAAFDEYVVQVGTYPGGSDLATAQVPSWSTSFTVSVPHGYTGYARVAARVSGTGEQGAFSASSDGITVDQTPPLAPGKPSGTYAAGRITWTWPAATDPESGIFSHQITIYVNGMPYLNDTIDIGTTYSFLVPTWATSVTAEVGSVNGVGVQGDLSEMSDPIAIDAQPPQVVELQPWNGSTNVATSSDVVIRFSEPMDRASVEAAFSLAYGVTRPRNGYVLAWNAESTEVRIVPDTQDPVGATNVDLLPERTAVTATVAQTAKDLAGNSLLGAFVATFTTADETAPRLLSLSVAGVPSPVPAASVQGGFTLDLGFDEDMDPTRAGASLSYGNDRLEARYGSHGLQNVLLGGGTATYVLWDCPDVRVGDVVTVRDTQPRDLEVVRATVTAVNRTGPCSFTVASAASAAYGGGGWAAIPSGNGARPRWSGPRTLSVVFEPWVSLAPGSDTPLEVWDVNDGSGNWPRDARTSLQVRKAPGTDTTPPALLTSLPRQGGTAPGARLAILRFTEPLDRSTLAGVTAESSAGAFAYSVEYDNEEFGPMVFVMPKRAAPAGATVTIHVPGTVKDLAGNAMGSAVDLTYTVSPSADAGRPELLESLPPNGRPVWEVWDAQVAFVDGVSGALDAIDATTVGPEDVRIEDEAGRLLRGWRPEAEPGSAFLRLYQPRGGLSGGWVSMSVTSVMATDVTDRAVYTTSQPHGMTGAGAKVWVSMSDWRDQQFNANQAVVREIVSPTEFAVEWFGPDAASVGGGSASFPGAKTYTFLLLGVPGATGIDDVHGNALDPQVFQAYVQPWGNRVPIARDLRDLSVAASTSAAGRSLELELGLRDADTQTVHVSVFVRVGGTDVPLASYAMDVSADPWGSGWYRAPQDFGGPPIADSDPALASLPTGPYPVVITLSDGIDTTTYVRDVFLWSPADVPSLGGVHDGGTFRPMSPIHPPVVENGPSPTLEWTLAPGAAPDFLGVYVASLDAVGDQGGGYLEALVAPPDVVSLVAPSPLPTDVYLWTVVQQRFAEGTNDPLSAGWAIDFRSMLGSLFVVGPDNDVLGGAEYGAARVGFERSGSGALSGVSDATGSWTFLPGAGGEDPVFVSALMTDDTGALLPETQQLFAYGAADAAFTVTEAVSGSPVPLPLPMRGAMGRAGSMFAVAQANESVPSIAAGAYRYQTSGFGTSLDGRFAFVQLEAHATGGLVNGAGGSVGTATFAGAGSTTGSVSLTSNDGGAQTFDVPYTLDDDGLLSLAVGDPGEYARGFVGGVSGAEVAALALDGQAAGTDERTFWLLMARARDWTGVETEAVLSGDYRFADLSVELDPGSSGYRANGASGTLRFDGQGGFTYAVNTPRGVELGAGSYEVDPVAEQVRIHVLKGSGTATLTLLVGPDFDTLLGMSTFDPNYAEVLVVTR